MRRPTFSRAMDDHPKLKGKQSRLPDHIQAKIIRAKMKKKAEMKKSAQLRKIAYMGESNEEISKRMNKDPVSSGIRAGLLGSALGGIVGGKRGALLGGGIAAGANELERRVRSRVARARSKK